MDNLTIDQLRAEVLNLPPTERTALALDLVASLDGTLGSPDSNVTESNFR